MSLPFFFFNFFNFMSLLFNKLPRLVITFLPRSKRLLISWPTKVCLVKAMVFPVVMYGFESWTINKGEH